MIYPLAGQNFNSIADFVSAINKARLENPNKWIAFVGYVQNKSVQLKNFGNGYLQIYRVDGIDYTPSLETKVSEWKKAIIRPFE
jgi:hypothetical protein